MGWHKATRTQVIKSTQKNTKTRLQNINNKETMLCSKTYQTRTYYITTVPLKKKKNSLGFCLKHTKQDHKNKRKHKET